MSEIIPMARGEAGDEHRGSEVKYRGALGAAALFNFPRLAMQRCQPRQSAGASLVQAPHWRAGASFPLSGRNGRNHTTRTPLRGRQQQQGRAPPERALACSPMAGAMDRGATQPHRGARVVLSAQSEPPRLTSYIRAPDSTHLLGCFASASAAAVYTSPCKPEG
jgi:hypothetical protein